MYVPGGEGCIRFEDDLPCFICKYKAENIEKDPCNHTVKCNICKEDYTFCDKHIDESCPKCKNKIWIRKLEWVYCSNCNKETNKEQWEFIENKRCVACGSHDFFNLDG